MNLLETLAACGVLALLIVWVIVKAVLRHGGIHAGAHFRFGGQLPPTYDNQKDE